MSERDNKRGNTGKRKPGSRPEKERQESKKSDDKRRSSGPYADRGDERKDRKPDSRKRTADGSTRKTGGRSGESYSGGKPYGERSDDRNTRRQDSRKYTNESRDEGSSGDRSTSRRYTPGKPFGERSGDRNTRRPDLSKRRFEKPGEEITPGGRPSVRKYPASKPFGYRGKRAVADGPKDDSMRLNKYISNSGICSRREADDLIKTGLVEVNGKPVTEMGYKVMPNDIVKYAGEKITPEKPVYFLLNKPKDYTAEMKSTTDRRNGITLMRGIGNHNVMPVGKIDRSTSGLVIYTNDGDLTMKLCNPKLGLKKLFHVHLDKNIKKEHLDEMVAGIELEDGFVKAEEVSYVGDKNDKKQIGIEMKSGKNKAVRHMLEHLGYYVVKLDRVMYAGLTKKDLPRGKWRALTPQEVINLKMLK